jgi:hypothetical protein
MNSESRHEPTDPSGAKPQASQSPVVRRALPSERSAVAAMVAAAFSADPAWTFIFGSEYERLAQHFAAALFDVRVNSSTVWVTDDLAAVAMWDSPGKSAESPEYAEEVWKRYRATSGAEAYLRLLAYNDAVMAVAATAAGDYWCERCARTGSRGGRSPADRLLPGDLDRGEPALLRTPRLHAGKRCAGAGRTGHVVAAQGSGAVLSPLQWLARRDRDLAALRRAGRTAIVMPAMFALGDKIIDNPALATFAAFGSFAMLLLVDFGGTLRERLQAQAMLGLTGCAFVCLGTLASQNVWVAAAGTALVGFAVIFAGVVSSVLAGATTSLLLSFILPVTTAGPVSSIPDRVAGWGLASVAGLIAVGFLWPAPVRGPLRSAAASACPTGR